jgi:hypothetical protein
MARRWLRGGPVLEYVACMPQAKGQKCRECRPAAGHLRADPADYPNHRLLIPFIFADPAVFPCLVAPHHGITGGAPRKAP